jgi:hypothetical protein
VCRIAYFGYTICVCGKVFMYSCGKSQFPGDCCVLRMCIVFLRDEHINLSTQEFDALEGTMHMWVESDNIMHMVDGKSFKATYGGVYPHNLLTSEKLDVIYQQVSKARRPAIILNCGLI